MYGITSDKIFYQQVNLKTQDTLSAILPNEEDFNLNNSLMQEIHFKYTEN